MSWTRVIGTLSEREIAEALEQGRELLAVLGSESGGIGRNN